MEYQNYNEVPWYRKSKANSWFVLLGIFIPPFIWVVAYILATGDVYYSSLNKEGNLFKWSVANKVIAWIIIILQLYFWVIRRVI